ncbi:MFS transporter [Levilinea saccharolytica]|uniref:Major facilitator superfamily (MFS) profile domain-containing protein n=1 Tax=Levilinea saccharolytica TaxID=229921 RepID=A0A0P6XYL3_9CHLR|nr:MFS transporter [Levilinea saccharolytica]KPL84968.1 hypothetical protein ADN01_06150 [Levilinea saccharolytica]GAP18055.1 major facilitator superfamily [Levilinea saccharolytica]
MKRDIRWYDYLTLNAFWMGLTTLSQTMTPLIIPLLVQQFVGEALKGTYYGRLRLWTLMTALLVQALMGMLSDRSNHPWGRRRPFIVAGTLGLIVVLTLVGFTAGLEGLGGYWVLFTLIILQMVAANTAHGAQQGLIPDLVPNDLRGRFSGVKAVLEVPIPVILVSFTIARLVASGNLWGGLLVLMFILLLCMGLSLLIPEERNQREYEALDWQPFLRLVVMTATFTLVILLMEWVIQGVSSLAAGLSSTAVVAVLFLAGVVCMGAAVILGVWFSVRVGLGKDAVSNSSFTWWVISRLAFLVGSTNLASFTVYFLQGRFGYVGEQAAKPAAQLTMFVGIFILLSAIPSGWLSDRFGRKPMLVLSGIVAAVGTLCVIFAPGMSVVYLGGVLIGMATGLFYAVNWALGTEIVPKAEAGRFLGISNLAGAGAGAVGAYIGGPIADHITRLAPDLPGVGYAALFAIYAILLLFSVLALKGIHQKPATVN